MGMIRGRRSRRLHPRRCPLPSRPLSPSHEALLAYLATLPATILVSPDVETPPTPPTPPASLPSEVRHNYDQHCEVAINKQINLELHASYTYLSMAFFFDRQEVAGKRFATFFFRQWREEWERAQTLMRLQNRRGGLILLRDIRRSDRCHWESGLRALKCASRLQRMVTQHVVRLFRLATLQNDAHLCGFLQSRYLRPDVKSIKNLEDSITNLSELGAEEPSLADYLFAKLSLGDGEEN